MSFQKSISYTFLKNGIFYYNRLIPMSNDWPNQGKSLDKVKSTDGNLGLILGI